jgi:asparagine synthase (glutamine-hydrolysing)
VGAFLSAGLDSSSIVAAMSQLREPPVRTYTIAFPDKHRIGETTLDDPDVASRMAKFAGCEHHRIVVEANAAELLPKLTWHMDEPTADPALLTAFLVCKEARRSSTVLLSGVGGDELFAGYRKYAAHYWGESLQKIPAGLRGYLEKRAIGLPPLRGTRWKGRVRLAKKMARSASLSSVDRFLMNCTYLSGTQLSFLCTPEICAEFAGADPAIEHRRAFASVESADFLNQMLYVDSKLFMTSLNLTYNDKMSMATSVEVRVPFLDRDLAEFVAWNVPPSLKLRGHVRPTTKYLLRKAMKPFLPPEILQQPKAGFGAPVDYWLASDLKEMVSDLLSESTVAGRGLFRPAAVQQIRTEHAEGRFDWSMQIWQLLTLEIWMQTFMEAGSPTVLSASSSLGSEAIA